MLKFPDENWFGLSVLCEKSKTETRIIYSDFASQEKNNLEIAIQET